MKNSAIISSMIFFFIFMPVFLFAQDVLMSEEIFSHPLNENSRSEFSEVCSAISKHSIIKGNFTQSKYIKKINKTLVSKGIFLVAGKDGVVWDIRSPFPSVTAVGKECIIQFAGGEKSIFDGSKNPVFRRFSEVISSVFAGEEELLLKNFDICFTGSTAEWTLGLVPSESAVRQMIAAIKMEGNSVIHTVILFETSGDSIKYDFSDHTFPGELTENEKELLHF